MNELTPHGVVNDPGNGAGLTPGDRCDQINNERIGAEPGRAGEESEAGFVMAASEMRSYVEKARFARRANSTSGGGAREANWLRVKPG
jgi:hypothetical protein